MIMYKIAALLLILSPSLYCFFEPLYCFLGVGIFTALLFFVDKAAALRQKWRIPEKVLLLACLMGGAVFGLAAMILCRHKVAKPRFFIPVMLIIFTQVVLILAWKYNIIPL